MQEWWPILAVFWALYLADGWQLGRRDRLFFSHRAARARAGAWHGRGFFALPWPTAWVVVTDDLPLSLSPEALTNWPSGSASRPPPLPDDVQQWRWEEVRSVETRGQWIRINGRRFAPETRALDAAELRRLAEVLGPLAADARAGVLCEWQSRRLQVQRLRRRITVVWRRSEVLACLNAVQVLLLVALSVFVALGVPSTWSPRWLEVAGATLPYLLGGYALAHVGAVVLWWRLHRRFWPRRVADRWGDFVTLLLVPAQALRMRARLVAALAPAEHPLAVALAVGSPATIRSLARNTLADLRWPVRPAGLPEEVAATAAAAAALLGPLVEQCLSRSGEHDMRQPVEALLAPPARVGAEVCAWCPRCGDTFVRPLSHCAHGVPLQPLPDASADRR